MQTTINTTVLTGNPTIVRKKALFSQEFLATAEYNRFGIVPAILTIIICLTAFAAAFAAQMGVGAVTLIAVPTAFFISTIIAVAPMRIIFAFTAITILVDLMVFLFVMLNW